MESGRFIGKVKPDKVQSCNNGVTVLVGLVGLVALWSCFKLCRTLPGFDS